MLNVKLICVGKMRERFYTDAFAEYAKRLQSYCRLTVSEPQELRLPDAPSDKEIAMALDKESTEILREIPPDAFVAALCVEGRELSSEQLASLVAERESSGKPKLCCIIGGSYGLSDKVKQRADVRLSMSRMTFPHHLARVMLIEQLYRAFKINEGSKYHK